MTPLHSACRYGHLGVVELLTSKGVSLEVATEKKWMPLLFAVLGRDYGNGAERL
jgi:ankyrin repeat protein